MKKSQPKAITPLRTAGGKSKVIKKILDKYIPVDYTEYYEPFVGGGSVALWERQKFLYGVFHINDLNYNLYCFWNILQNEPQNLIATVENIRIENDPNDIEQGRKLLAEMQKLLRCYKFGRAVAFYVLNKISFSGLTEHGSLSKEAYRKTFNMRNIQRLWEVCELIDGFEITNLDYEEAIKNATKDDFIFLDPPYSLGEKSTLYGKDGELHKNFDHRRFFEVISQSKARWMITYNNNETLRDWYKDFNIYEEVYRYCMAFKTDEKGIKHTRLKTELVITNYKVD